MKVLMLLDNIFSVDQRVLREAKTLLDAGYDIKVYCLKDKNTKEKEIINGIPVERIFSEEIFNIKNKSYLKQMAAKLASQDFDVLHCHDQTMLHLGSLIKQLKKEVRLIYDSHEMFHMWPLNLPSETSPITRLKSRLVRKLQVRREKKNGKYIDHLITVSESIANRLKQYFRLATPPTTLRNITVLNNNLLPVDIRKKLQIPQHKKIIVFIAKNIYVQSQNLNQFIGEIANDQQMAFVIISSENEGRLFFENEVKQKKIKNVFFHDFIPANELINYLASCDIGLLPFWNKANLSYWYSLPNKLFDYIMAEIPVLSTSQPEFTKLIEQYDSGICINPENKNAFKKGYQSILKNYDHYKLNTKKAKKELNWEKEKEKLLNLYKSLS